MLETEGEGGTGTTLVVLNFTLAFSSCKEILAATELFAAAATVQYEEKHMDVWITGLCGETGVLF